MRNPLYKELERVVTRHPQVASELARLLDLSPQMVRQATLDPHTFSHVQWQGVHQALRLNEGGQLPSDMNLDAAASYVAEFDKACLVPQVLLENRRENLTRLTRIKGSTARLSLLLGVSVSTIHGTLAGTNGKFGPGVGPRYAQRLSLPTHWFDLDEPAIPALLERALDPQKSTVEEAFRLIATSDMRISPIPKPVWRLPSARGAETPSRVAACAGPDNLTSISIRERALTALCASYESKIEWLTAQLARAKQPPSLNEGQRKPRKR
jgi:hypothetical protein